MNLDSLLKKINEAINLYNILKGIFIGFYITLIFQIIGRLLTFYFISAASTIHYLLYSGLIERPILGVLSVMIFTTPFLIIVLVMFYFIWGYIEKKEQGAASEPHT